MDVFFLSHIKMTLCFCCCCENAAHEIYDCITFNRHLANSLKMLFEGMMISAHNFWRKKKLKSHTHNMCHIHWHSWVAADVSVQFSNGLLRSIPIRRVSLPHNLCRSPFSASHVSPTRNVYQLQIATQNCRHFDSSSTKEWAKKNWTLLLISTNKRFCV